MKVDVYDTYARTFDGGVMHFDVLIPSTAEPKRAYAFAQQWLSSINARSESLSQDQCRFCHQEEASDIVAEDIRFQGYHIIQMEGCPNPA